MQMINFLFGRGVWSAEPAGTTDAGIRRRWILFTRRRDDHYVVGAVAPYLNSLTIAQLKESLARAVVRRRARRRADSY